MYKDNRLKCNQTEAGECQCCQHFGINILHQKIMKENKGKSLSVDFKGPVLDFFLF